MEEFLNPKSMVTPGVAGGVMMFLVNGLTSAFPEMAPRYLALALAFVIGAFVVVRASRITPIERILYWLVTSLVIFVVGYGTNHLGQAAVEVATGGHGSVSLSALLPRAYAEDAASEPAPAKKVAKVAHSPKASAKAGTGTAAPAGGGREAPDPAIQAAHEAEIRKLQQQLVELEAKRQALEDANVQLKQGAAQQAAPPPPASMAQQPQSQSASFFKKW